MSKTFADKDLLIWEAFPSGGAHGFSENPHIIFNCLTNRMMRPRVIDYQGDEASAEGCVSDASPAELLKMFEGSREIA